MKNGSTTEIGLIGQEGMIGTMAFLGKGTSNSQSIVQSPGWAMRIELKKLRSLLRGCQPILMSESGQTQSVII